MIFMESQNFEYFCLYFSVTRSGKTGERVLKFSFNKKLESVTRKITLKLVSLLSLRLCR